jgi:AcrR family transcriptional regulator
LLDDFKRWTKLMSHEAISPAGNHGRKPRASVRERQKELTRDQITDSALEEFERNGYLMTTLDGIATVANVSRPTIYRHFKDKPSILRATVAGLPVVQPLLDEIAAATDRPGRLQAFNALNVYWHEHLGRVWKFVREAAAVDPEMRDWVERIARNQTEFWRSAFQKNGVPVDLARARAFLLWSLWNEYLFRLSEVTVELEWEAAVTALTDYYEAALLPPTPEGP